MHLTYHKSTHNNNRNLLSKTKSINISLHNFSSCTNTRYGGRTHDELILTDQRRGNGTTPPVYYHGDELEKKERDTKLTHDVKINK